MPPEDIDNLFRDQLAGHETPPGDALWTRLNATPAPNIIPNAATERLDQLFQKGLNAHATRPGRALWERLEDEHLRPRKHRATAWWPVALAAALALLLIAGGAGLWLGFPMSNSRMNTVASHTKRDGQSAAGKQPNNTSLTNTSAPATQIDSKQAVAANSPQALPQTAAAGTVQKNTMVQATRSAMLASTAPKASMAASGPSLRHPLGSPRLPDAAAEHRLPVATTTTRTVTRPAPIPRPAADEQRPNMAPTVAIAAKSMPAPEIVPAVPIITTAASLASAGELITVDVRNGGNPADRPTKTTSTALAAAEAPEERRGLGGRLLQQAGHLVRGERVSLAEVTGLPENMTLRATIAGRSVSKYIQL